MLAGFAETVSGKIMCKVCSITSVTTYYRSWPNQSCCTRYCSVCSDVKQCWFPSDKKQTTRSLSLPRLLPLTQPVLLPFIYGTTDDIVTSALNMSEITIANTVARYSQLSTCFELFLWEHNCRGQVRAVMMSNLRIPLREVSAVERL